MKTPDRTCLPAASRRGRAFRALAFRPLVALSLCLDSVCSGHATRQKLSPDAVVVAFGDSLTYGSGADQGEAYPAVLEKLIGRRVVNAGVPGELSSEGLERLPRVLDEISPALVIVCHGGNDLLQQDSEEIVGRNLLAMLDAARVRGVPAVLIGVPRPGVFLRTAAVYERVASEARVPLESKALSRIEADPSLKSDMIHPNREGYREMAEAVSETLRKAGFV